MCQEKEDCGCGCQEIAPKPLYEKSNSIMSLPDFWLYALSAWIGGYLVSKTDVILKSKAFRFIAGAIGIFFIIVAIIEVAAFLLIKSKDNAPDEKEDEPKEVVT